MSNTASATERTTLPSAASVDFKLEVFAIPVSDVDRAKAFYQSLGWTLDADFMIGKDFRAVQLTPPGSPCSIHLSTTAVPGSAQGMFLVVSDIEAARSELIARGADVSEVFHFDGDHKSCRARTRTSVLRLIRLVRRSRRQSLDSSAGQDAPSRTRTQPRRGDADGAVSRDRETAWRRTSRRRRSTTGPAGMRPTWLRASAGRAPDEAARDARHIEGALAAQA